MLNYREILRLLSLGYTQREIARSLHCSRNSVRDVSYASTQTGIKWPLDSSVTNADIHKQFHMAYETDSQYSVSWTFLSKISKDM